MQSTIGHAVTIRGAPLPFVFLVVARYALAAGTLPGLAFGLAAGACEDALVGATGAAWTLATGIAGLVIGRLRSRELWERPIVLASVAAATTLLRYFVYVVVLRIESVELGTPLRHTHTALVEAALIGAIAFAAGRIIHRQMSGHAYRR